MDCFLLHYPHAESASYPLKTQRRATRFNSVDGGVSSSLGAVGKGWRSKEVALESPSECVQDLLRTRHANPPTPDSLSSRKLKSSTFSITHRLVHLKASLEETYPRRSIACRSAETIFRAREFWLELGRIGIINVLLKKVHPAVVRCACPQSWGKILPVS
ncbi:hypothetical protein M407DRAFT_134219 [Tulasnella calospora MUT 4182]|uniref:Uncharacterized protein n=1 Tax=Tulasnella calospora MUT 4182 TaxID=1051891 RepID=A0A0C3Q8M4_9AGAM|nr:hypothetical protein M407DRAFT_134219 [Tulasnella calospora MUT 4182]